MAAVAIVSVFLGLLCYVIGVTIVFTAKRQRSRAGSPGRSGGPRRPSLGFVSRNTQEEAEAEPVRAETLNCPNCGGSVREADRQCPYCGSTLVAVSTAKRDVPQPLKLDWARVGGSIRVRDPVQGDSTVEVLGRIVYEELWQESRGPKNPWVPTGNAFLGLWLESDRFLLNWQNRFYLLGEREAAADVDIRRDFAPHARKFAKSDQTATVLFDYALARWRIDDIGKFRVQTVEGEGFRFRPRATGRFIHASSDELALVVEDYEGGGGGEDTVWRGHQIREEDVQKAS
ncbi:MAG: hypothetical protein A2V98_24815 [Planctomycetes bacterium RBG_16_64_12]|nr:MAG: hypothetical protein A2V98_24815 [Planctomycetes bacterium RBG_16_64_12]